MGATERLDRHEIRVVVGKAMDDLIHFSRSFISDIGRDCRINNFAFNDLPKNFLVKGLL